MAEGVVGSDAAPGGAGEEATLEKERLAHIFDGARIFAGGGGDGFEADGAAFVFFDDAFKDLAIKVIEAEVIDSESIEGMVGDGFGDDAVAIDLGEISDSSEEAVGDAGGASGSFGDGFSALFIDFDPEDCGGSADNVVEGVVVVESEVHDDAESVAEGASEVALAGGSSNDGEGGDIEPNRPCGGALADHDVDFAVFHGGVEDFFDLAGEAVDFVDEEHGVGFKVGEDPDEIPGAHDCGAGSDVDDSLHLRCDDVGEGGFAESGRTVEEKVVEGFFALFGGF